MRGRSTSIGVGGGWLNQGIAAAAAPIATAITPAPISSHFFDDDERAGAAALRPWPFSAAPDDGDAAI